MDSFDYIITDLDNKVNVYKSYILNQPVSGNSYSEFEDFFRGDALLNRTYHTCFITNCSPYFTLVPDNLYKESEKDQYLEQVADLGTRYQVEDEVLPTAGSVSVFAVHQFLIGWSRNRFKKHTKSHLINTLIKMAHLEEHKTHQDRIYLYQTGNILAVCLIKKGYLHFCNIFEVLTPEQFIYYLGLMISQFQLSQLDTKVYLLGGFEKENSFLEQLQIYLPNLEHATLPTSIGLATNLQSLSHNQLLLPAVSLL